MKRTMAAMLIAVAAAAGCSSGDADEQLATTSSSAPNISPTTTTLAPPTVSDIASEFRDAVNRRDFDAVAGLAPNTSASIREFLIGGGPYGAVDCDDFGEPDECHVVNGVADFVFVIDVAAGLVTEVTYVGGA